MDTCGDCCDERYKYPSEKSLDRTVSDIVADVCEDFNEMSDDDSVSLTYEEYCEQAIILQELKEIDNRNNRQNRQKNANALRITGSDEQFVALEKPNEDTYRPGSPTSIKEYKMTSTNLACKVKEILYNQGNSNARRSFSEGEIGLPSLVAGDKLGSEDRDKIVEQTKRKTDASSLNNMAAVEPEMPPMYFPTDSFSKPQNKYKLDSYIHNDLLRYPSSNMSHQQSDDTKKRSTVPIDLLEALDRKLTYICDVISFTRGFILGGDRYRDGCTNIVDGFETECTLAPTKDENIISDQRSQDREILNSIKQIIVDLSEEIEKFRYDFRSHAGDFLGNASPTALLFSEPIISDQVRVVFKQCFSYQMADFGDTVAELEKHGSCPSDIAVCIDKQAAAIDRMRKEKRSMKNKLMAKEREWTASNQHMYEEIRSLRQHVTQLEAMLAGQCRYSGRRQSLTTAFRISEDLNMALSLDAIKQNKINELKLLTISQHHYISSLEDRNAELERSVSLLMNGGANIKSSRTENMKNEMQDLLKCDNAEYLPGKITSPELASCSVFLEPGSAILGNNPNDNEENEFLPLKLSYIKHSLQHSVLDDEVLELHDFLTKYGPGSKNFSLMD